MSYDIRLESATCPECGHEDIDFSWNYTSNMVPAWIEAGANLAEFDGKVAEQCAPALRAAIERMEAEPLFYAKYNSPNGWGSMETLIPALKRLLGGMTTYPQHRVVVSR